MVRSNKNAVCLWGIRSPVFAAHLAEEARGRTPFGFSDMLPACSLRQRVTLALAALINQRRRLLALTAGFR